MRSVRILALAACAAMPLGAGAIWAAPATPGATVATKAAAPSGVIQVQQQRGMSPGQMYTRGAAPSGRAGPSGGPGRAFSGNRGPNRAFSGNSGPRRAYSGNPGRRAFAGNSGRRAMAPGDIYTQGVRPNRHSGRHHGGGHGHGHHRHNRRYYGGYPYFYDDGPSYYYDDAYLYDEGPAYADYDDDAVERCAARYRSFDPSTGTYLHVSGERRLCPYLG